MNDERTIGLELGLPFPVKVESSVPPPVGNTRSGWAALWQNVEPGESFCVDLRYSGAVRAAAAALGLRVCSRTVADGVRWWRLPDDPQEFVATADDRKRVLMEQGQKAAEVERWLRQTCERKHGASIGSEVMFQRYLSAMLDAQRQPLTRREFNRICTDLMMSLFGAHRSSSVPEPLTGRMCKGWRSVAFKTNEETANDGNEGKTEKTA